MRKRWRLGKGWCVFTFQFLRKVAVFAALPPRLSGDRPLLGLLLEPEIAVAALLKDEVGDTHQAIEIVNLDCLARALRPHDARAQAHRSAPGQARIVLTVR
jgi:hypothetical protein